MAAPIGNRFWELRSKHGRKRLFETPQLLWEAACEYFKWCEDNPIIETDFRGKDNTMVLIPRLRAFTIHGLCLYLDCNVMYFNDFERSLRERDDEFSKDFSIVLTRVKSTIYDQKFTGASANQLNASIIARDLGLSDKKELQGGISVQTITGMEII